MQCTVNICMPGTKEIPQNCSLITCLSECVCLTNKSGVNKYHSEFESEGEVSCFKLLKTRDPLLLPAAPDVQWPLVCELFRLIFCFRKTNHSLNYTVSIVGFSEFTTDCIIWIPQWRWNFRSERWRNLDNTQVAICNMAAPQKSCITMFMSHLVCF